MNSSSGPLWLLLAVVVILAIAAAAGVIFLRKQILRGSSLEDDELEQVRAALLDGVKGASVELGTPVLLANFWKQVGLSRGDRYRVMQPLIDQGLLKTVPGQSGEFGKFLSEVVSSATCGLPDRVVLNSRDWWRMTNGESAITIIEEQFVDYHPIDVTTTVNGSGTIGAVTVAGGDAYAETKDVKGGVRDISPEFVGQMIVALRQDAQSLAHDAADELRSVAEDLEEENKKPQPSQSRLKDLFNKVKLFATFAASGMTATKGILDAFESIQK